MADEAKLIAVVEARTQQFERALKRIEASTDKAFRGGASNVVRFNRGLDAGAASATRLERAMTRVNAQQGRFAGIGRSLAGGLLAGAGVAGILSLTGAITKARSALAEFDEIAKSARTTGLTPEFFQSLTFAAVETGIGQEKLNAALLIFNKNSGLAAQGTGALSAGLKRMNPELLKAINLATTQDEKLRLVAEAMRAASTASERAALSSLAFGRSGVELTEIFGAGAAGLDDFMKRASEMGLIIDRELLNKADQLDDKLSVLSKVIDTNLNVALIELAPLLLSVAQAVADTAKEVRALIDWWKGLVGVMNSTPGGSEMFERFKGLAFDLDLGAQRMEEFRQSTAGAAVEAQRLADEALVSVKAVIEAISKAGNRDAFEGPLHDLGLLHALLSEGTPEAARKASAVLDDLAKQHPGFQLLANKIQPVIDKLLEMAGAASSAADEIAGIPHATIRLIGSASDLAREAGGKRQQFLDEQRLESQKSELDREIDRKADEILRAADAAGVALTRGAARIEAAAQIAAGNLQRVSTETASGAAELIARFESFRANAYPDMTMRGGRRVNSGFRNGFGSDTMTDEKGFVSSVTRESVTTVTDAMRDLTRRVAKIQVELIRTIGQEAYDRLTAETKEALTSVIYNYGQLPSRLTAAVQGGDPRTIAVGITRLQNDNSGINRNRRLAEASHIMGGDSEFAVKPEDVAAVNSLADAYKKTGLAAEEAAKGADKFGFSQDQANARAEEFAGIARDALGGFIRDLRAGKSGAEALANALNTVADRLLDMALNSMFKGGGGGGGFGGFFARLFGGGKFGGFGIAAGLHHQGGVAGYATQHRMVPAGAFAGAHRYHGGGMAGFRPGEVPAILQRGEIIMPRLRAGSNGGGQGSQQVGISIDVRGARGNKEIQEMVAAGMQQAIVEGQRATRVNLAGYIREAQIRTL